ncbi:hypothetical protein F4680DRAFT_446197 [Xylaria scruposa]|nr:hypothetical protein F4680DRAFT_446197 [Xylaria scruposa]
MPFPPGTRRISPEEWEEHKSRIIELFLTSRRTLDGPDGVIEMMKQEGFDATVAQYEHQFRKWNVRKNKSRTKQARLVDGAHQGGDGVQGSNQTMSRARARRVWRRPALRNHQGEELVPYNFDSTAQVISRHVPELDSEGAVLNVETDLTAVAADAGVDRIVLNQNIQSSTGTTDDWHGAENIVVDSTSNFHISQDLSNLPWNFSNSSTHEIPFSPLQPGLNDPTQNLSDFSPLEISFDLSPRQFNSIVESKGQSPTNDMSHVGATPFEPSSPVLFSRHCWLQHPLPSAQLAAMFIDCVYIKSPFASTSCVPAEIIDPQFLFKFLNVVAESAPSSRDLTAISVPHSLTSLETFAGEEWSQLAQLSHEKYLEALFDARLFSSVINSFPGLQGIPAAGVLKFLNRHPASQQMMLDFFKASSSPLAKSFIEKAFVAYIETDNVEVIKFLCNSRLLDADNAVCCYKGQRYTPLEYAAIKQSFKVLQFLIAQGVDVNKSLPRDYTSNALFLLIREAENHRATLSRDFLRSVDALLQAQATILITTINEALEFSDPQLSVLILRTILSQEPQKIILENSLLKSIILNLDKQNATEIVRLIINKRLELGKPLPLHTLDNIIDGVFEVAVQRRYDDLAGILFPYMSSAAKALQIARKEENQTILELIFHNYPGLDDDPDSENDTGVSHLFISALESGDQNLLHSLDNSGAIKDLGYGLGQALAAALRVGNLEYATKFLELDPDFIFCHLTNDIEFEVADSLCDALTHNFDDIAWKLLAAGIVAETLNDSYSLLCVAIQKERPELVKTIIEFGIDLRLIASGSRILEVAFECSDESIFDDVWKAYHGQIYPSLRLYELVLQKGRRDLFFDIVKASPQLSDHCKKLALEAAVTCENESVLDELVSLGAPADDDGILEKAMKNHPSMVRPLLDLFWRTYPQGRAGYGKLIISEALRDYPKSAKPLKMVFDWNLVTMNIDEIPCPVYRDLSNTITERLQWSDTFLIEAIKTRDCRVVQMFIDAGSKVNTIAEDRGCGNSYSRTSALLEAIDIGNIEMVQLLIDHDANVNEPARFSLRRTPLQKAAEMNNLPIVRLLLKSGADINAAPPKFDGATALQFAAIHGNCEMATILIEHGARQDILPPIGPRGRYPLEGAAENGRFDMLELLWVAPREPFDDEQCQKAMRLAERNGHIGCKEKIEELMARCATPQTSMLQD